MNNYGFFTLYDVSLNKRCIITSLECEKNLNKRLTDLGLGRGSVVIPAYKSPFKDVFAYYAGGTLIALRAEDCKKINVEPENFKKTIAI